MRNDLPLPHCPCTTLNRMKITQKYHVEELLQ